MKNVSDIYYEKELLHIICDRVAQQEIPEETVKSSAVAVNIYYPDTVEKCLGYLKKVPMEMDIYIVSSEEIVLGIARDFAATRVNVRVLEKENRGRDVSALLVTLREQLMKYKYICFVHDKKPHFNYLKEDIEFWFYNLWENTLKSESYIKNIVGILEKEKTGMLVPPEPIGRYTDSWYVNAWEGDLKNVQELAKGMGLAADIVYERPPIALGTVFWAKTKALKKLFDMNWSYEDFPNEPMPIDGTLSHAIERILPYVVQDAGFDTEVIMTMNYAQKLLLKTQKMMRESFDLLWDRFGIRNVHQLTHYAEQERAAGELFEQCDNVYLYGAGDWGKRFLKTLESWGYKPKGFVVSDGNRKKPYIEGYHVYELGEICLEDSNGFIISTNYHLQDEVERSLLARGFDRYFKVILA